MPKGDKDQWNRSRLNATIPSPSADDFAVALGIKESRGAQRLDDFDRTCKVQDMVRRLEQDDPEQKRAVLGRFTAEHMDVFIAKWRECDPDAAAYPMFLTIFCAIQDDDYFFTYLALTPGAGIAILRRLAASLASVRWDCEADEEHIYDTSQLLATMACIEVSERGAIPSQLVPPLVKQLKSWDAMFSFHPAEDDQNFRNPRLPIRRALALVKRDQHWIALCDQKNQRDQRRMFACQFPPCGAFHRLDLYRKCSTCRTARYCSAECQKQHWKAHKRFCFALKFAPSTSAQA